MVRVDLGLEELLGLAEGLDRLVAAGRGREVEERPGEGDDGKRELAQFLIPEKESEEPGDDLGPVRGGSLRRVRRARRSLRALRTP